MGCTYKISALCALRRDWLTLIVVVTWLLMFVCKLTDSIFMVAMQRDFYIHLYLNNRKYMSIRAFVCSNCSVDRTFTRIFFYVAVDI